MNEKMCYKAKFVYIFRDRCAMSGTYFGGIYQLKRYGRVPYILVIEAYTKIVQLNENNI